MLGRNAALIHGLLVMAVLAGCGTSPSPGPPLDGGAGDTDSGPSDGGLPPSDDGSPCDDAADCDAALEWAPCDPDELPPGYSVPADLVCTTLEVPVDREDPDGRTLTLRVALHRSRGAEPAQTAVFQLAGGPGGSAVAQAGIIEIVMPDLPTFASRQSLAPAGSDRIAKLVYSAAAMKKTLAMVFAGGRGAEYSVLTDRRPKAAVIFCGLYRTIDFALTNLSAAGIRTVGVLAQYRHSSLMDHVGSGLAWDLLGTDRGVRFLPPYLATEAGSFYRGPAEALYQNIDFIERNQVDDVLVVSGDQVYSMDYEPLLQFHRERDADLTMAFKPIDDRPSRFGIGEINATGQLLRFTEKPDLPRTNLASIGIYVFKQRVLVDELRRAVRGDRDATSQIHEILHRMIPRRRAYGWTFRGPWFYVETLDAYVDLHRRLVGSPPELDLSRWGMRTNPLARRTPPPPARFASGAVVEDSFVASGCVIEGRVHGSVLSPGVRVAPGAVVERCVLWDDVVVGAGTRLRDVVCDKRTRIGDGVVIGEGDDRPNETLPQSLSCGATVLGMDAAVPNGARIGRNCIVEAQVGSEIDQEVASGRTVSRRAAAEDGAP